MTTGVYAHTRNPMYMGHVVFLTGLTLLTRSPLALAVTAALVPWFDERAAAPTTRVLLSTFFGEPYQQYAARVPRWLRASRTDPVGRQ